MKKQSGRVFRNNLAILNSLATNSNLKEFWYHFNKLCITPRNSSEEKDVVKVISDIAGGYDREFIIDEWNNLLVRLPATPGYEHLPMCCIQSHTDMVCKTDDGVEIFPIELLPLKDGILTANGTTLGGDDGVGVAAMMMLITDTSIPHGPLELLFTATEETGLIGAKNFDYTQLKSLKIINLDSETFGTFYVGSAGGGIVNSSIPVIHGQSVKTQMIKCSVKISGLLGGHSGECIHLNRANAITVLAKLLSGFEWEDGLLLVSLNGGEKMNAIPQNSKAEFLLPASSLPRFNGIVSTFRDKFHKEYPLEETAKISLQKIEVDKDDLPFTSRSTKVLLELLTTLPDGLIAMEPGKDLAQTSNNIAMMHTEKNLVRITSMYRSSVAAVLPQLEKTIVNAFEKAGGIVEIDNRFVPWEPQFGTSLLQSAQKVYFSLFGEKAIEEATHGGLELGEIYQKIPNAEYLSFGPSLYDVHTTKESLDVTSVPKYVDLLKAILIAV